MTSSINPHRHDSPSVADRAGAALPPAAPATNSDTLAHESRKAGSEIASPSVKAQGQPAGGKGTDCSFDDDEKARPANSKWTDQDKRKIAAMLRDGLSASQIGAEMHVGRGAIVGIVGRDKVLKTIGFAREPGGQSMAKSIAIKANRKRGAPGGIAGKSLREARRKKSQAKAEEGVTAKGFTPVDAAGRLASGRTLAATSEGKDVTSPGGENPAPRFLALVDLQASDCRFIVCATGEHARFCGHQVRLGSPWCPHHHGLCCVPHSAREAA